MRASFTKPTKAAWFFFLTGMITTVSLGIWQIQRLEEKTALIARIEQAQQGEAVSDIPREEAALRALEFYPVTLTGMWVRDVHFTIAARYFRGTVGYHLLQPLTLADGRVALVNRGWIAPEMKDRPPLESGRARLTATLRIGADRNWFTPESQPEKNMWFGRDVAAMSAHAGLKQIVPATFDVIAPIVKGEFPVPSGGEIKLRNDHLSYILTWFGIALGMIVIFVLSHRKKG